MGIKDLLRFMKPYTEPIHIQKYSGNRVGIDAYSWLHKGAYSCSMELSLNSEGDKKYQYISYFMHRINLLKHHKITPVVVFDGANFPSKAATENDRYRRRKANKDMAMEKLREGNVNAATELFQRAISITPAMAHQLIQVLRSENVEFIVAPYEADAQLAYLSSLGEKEGGIQAVISEDSDLLAYGCPSVIFKMDKFGKGEEIALAKVFNSTDVKPSFRNFNQALFIEMCVLAGCDFLPSIPGIGICKAHSLVLKYRNIDRVLSVLKLQKSKQVPEDYARSFQEAVAVFQHAKIYNQSQKRLEHMKELPVQLLEALGGEVDFLGPDVPSSLAIAIAEGNLDPTTMEAYNCSTSYRSRQPSNTTQTYERSTVSIPANPSPEAGEGIMLGITKDKQGVFNRKNDRFISDPVFEIDGNKENRPDSCFTVYSSRNIKKTTEPGTCTMVAQKRVLNELKFSDEVAALATLAFPSKVDSLKNTGVSEGLQLNTPDNNPFRKRKCASETDSHENTGVSEGLLLNTLDNNPFRKRICVSEDNESRDTPVSGVTDCEQSESKSQVFESQESVNSKLKKLNDIKDEGVRVKKTKTGKCKSSDVKNGSSILNFFARI